MQELYQYVIPCRRYSHITLGIYFTIILYTDDKLAKITQTHTHRVIFIHDDLQEKCLCVGFLHLIRRKAHIGLHEKLLTSVANELLVQFPFNVSV
jgi:hypothetical protein